MIEQLENRMVVDSEWESLEKNTELSSEKLIEPGYREIGTRIFVPQSDAYYYALERCLNGAEDEQQEFKEMLVDWFYSGNWIKE